VVDPLLTAVNCIYRVDEPPLASGRDRVFDLVDLAVALLFLDGIPRAFVWFSASHISRVTVHVNGKVFHWFLYGFPAGHVSWGCVPVIWMVFRWLFNIDYSFVVILISSRGFPYPTCIPYLFRINLIQLLSNGLCIITSGR